MKLSFSDVILCNQLKNILTDKAISGDLVLKGLVLYCVVCQCASTVIELRPKSNKIRLIRVMHG